MKYKTLKELNAQPGDVVQYGTYTTKYTVQEGEYLKSHTDGKSYFYEDGWDSIKRFVVLSRAVRPWGEMTDGEKGKLLLAHHEGKVIEYLNIYGKWQSCQTGGCKPFLDAKKCFRVQPEPKIEVVTVHSSNPSGGSWDTDLGFDDTHRITYAIKDGEPDCSSIKMERLPDWWL